MRTALLSLSLLLAACDGRALDFPPETEAAAATIACHNNDDCREMHGRCVYYGCNGGGGHCVRVTTGVLECGGSMAACCVDASGQTFCQAGHFCSDGVCVGCRR